MERNGIHLRKKAVFATWNIRGANTAKLQVITNEMTRLNIKILGIAEHWMLGQGRFTMQKGNVMLYAGKKSGPRREGVGFILDKEATKSIIGYNPMSLRVITIRLKAHPINITIIQVYAPTSDASDENLESFCNTVQEALDKTPPRDLLVMMGDWNAKVGKTERKNSHIGIHGEQNERGVKLAEFCISNDLTIGNTIFPHHPRRLYTWSSPGERTRNQIDYIMVKRRWRTSLLNVKIRPDADCGSDHQLLLATTKIKLQTTTKRENATIYDIQNIPKAFTVEIRNRFTPLLQYAEEECTPEERTVDKNYIHHVRNSKEVYPQEKETKESMAEKHHHGHSRRDAHARLRAEETWRVGQGSTRSLGRRQMQTSEIISKRGVNIWNSLTRTQRKLAK